MTSGEQYQKTEKWRKLNREIDQCKMALAEYYAKEQEISEKNVAGKTARGFASLRDKLRGMNTEIKKSSGGFAALIQKLKNSLSHMKLFGAQSRKNGNMFGASLKNILKYGIGLESLLMLVNKLHTALSEGMQNLAKYSDAYGTPLNRNLSQIHSSLLQVKNALATAFEPIINAAAPYLVTLIRHLTAGTNALAQFFSALTGSMTWTRATYNTQNYAASLDQAAGSAKELKNELYGFDEITRQSDQDTGGAGGGGGGITAGDMFTEETVDNQFANFAQLVKDAWKKADFTELGGILGEKLRDALDDISWDGIQNRCQKIARSIGTLINGFIHTEGLAASIGKTVGNAINTGVGTANTFFKTTDFAGIGEFIATAANDAVATTDFRLIGETVANGIKAAVKTWYGFVTTFDFEGLGDKISESVNSFFESMSVKDIETGLTGWETLGKSLSGTLNGFKDTLKKAFEGIGWTEVKKAVGEVIGSFLKDIDIDTVGLIIGAVTIMNAGKLPALFATAIGNPHIALAALTVSGIVLTVKGIQWAIDREAFLEEATVLSHWLGETIWGENSEQSKYLDKYMEKFGRGIVGWIQGDFKLEEYLDEVLLPIINSFFDSVFENIESMFLRTPLGKLLGKMGMLGDKTTVSGGSGGGARSFDTGPVAPQVISGVKIKADVVTNSVQAQNNVNGTISQVNRGGQVKAVNTSVVSNGEKDAKGIHAAVAKAFGTLPLLETEVKNSPAEDARNIYTATQSEFGINRLHTGIRSDTSGTTLNAAAQSEFGRSSLHTGLKSDTSGVTLNNIAQSGYGSRNLSTGAVVSTTGARLREIIQGTFGAKSLSTGAYVSTSGTDLYNQISKKLADTVAVRGAIGVSIRAIVDSVSNKAGKKADGGVFAGGRWRPVTAYAGGGLPDTGQMFIARERGPELVGTIGSHTAVMNNGQIVSSVAAGVASAVAGVMAQFSGNTTPIVYVYLGSKEITDYVIKDVNQRTIATGACPISP